MKNKSWYYFEILCSTTPIKLTLQRSPFWILQVVEVKGLILVSHLMTLFDQEQGSLSHCVHVFKA